MIRSPSTLTSALALPVEWNDQLSISSKGRSNFYKGAAVRFGSGEVDIREVCREQRGRTVLVGHAIAVELMRNDEDHRQKSEQELKGKRREQDKKEEEGQKEKRIRGRIRRHKRLEKWAWKSRDEFFTEVSRGAPYSGYPEKTSRMANTSIA